MTRLTTVVVLVGGVLLAGVSLAMEPTGEYESVPFVGVNGDQYVDTGVYPNDGTKVEMEFAPLQSYAAGYTLFCARTSTSSSDRFMVHHQNSSGQYIMFSYGNVNNYSPKNLIQYQRTFVRVEKGGFYLDGESVPSAATAEPKSFTNKTARLVLFQSHQNNGSWGNKSQLRFYSCRIWTDGKTLSRDFIPVKRLLDGVGGLWDRVEGQFYESGTGTALLAPEIVYSKVDGTGNNSLLNENGVWGQGVKPDDYYKCYVLTNAAGFYAGTGQTANFGYALQIGEVGGVAADLTFQYWGSHNIRDCVLANGSFIPGQDGRTIGGRSFVISTEDAPFKLGGNTWGAINFTDQHQFVGGEDAVLAFNVRGWDAVRRVRLLGGNPQYFGKWSWANMCQVTLRHPEALGGERGTFAWDAIKIQNAGSFNASALYRAGFIFDFDGTMPSKGRGITLNYGSQNTEFVVLTGHVVRCDMPVKATAGSKGTLWIMSNNCRDDGAYVVEDAVSKFSLGAYNGSTLNISNVTTRIASVGDESASSLVMIDEKAAFWTEVDADGTSHYTTIGPNTTFTPYGGKIPLRVDLAATLPGGMSTLSLPVLKIDTAAKVVTKDDFVLVEDADFLAKTSRRAGVRLAVTTEGTTQTVNLVADPRGLMLLLR